MLLGTFVSLQSQRELCCRHYVSEGQVYDQRWNPSIGKVLKDKYLVRAAEKGCKVWHEVVKYCLRRKMRKYCLKSKMETISWSWKKSRLKQSLKGFQLLQSEMLLVLLTIVSLVRWIPKQFTQSWFLCCLNDSISRNVDLIANLIWMRGRSLERGVGGWQKKMGKYGRVQCCRPLWTKCERACAWAASLGVPPA